MTSLRRTILLHRTALGGLLLAACLAAPHAARADADADDKIAKLLDLLVQKKIVSSRQAHELLRQTEAGPTPRHVRGGAPAEAGDVPAKPGQIRVTYVPQFVRRQIADEVRAQVMTEAQQEGWSVPSVVPDWTRRFKLYGDLRARYERDSFDKGNYNQFINYASINNGAAFDVANFGQGTNTVGNPPFLNTTQDRDRPRIRARVGVEALIDDTLSADIRVSTGSDNGPVTPNQTLGQPGDFGKPNAYIDRAYFTYKPFRDFTAYVGRENNPFFTTDLIFYSELGFDGISASYTPKLTDTVSSFVAGGVFPILNSAFDLSTTSDQKSPSTNAYLLAIQGGAKWQARRDLAATFAVGFFDFDGVQGAVSSPCQEQVGSVFNCSTDSTRFPFQQFGNSVYAIRNFDIAQQRSNTPVQPEFFGLASRFAVLDVHPRIDITSYHPLDIMLEGEYLKNLAYDRAAILGHGPASYLLGPVNNIGNNGQYQSGDTAYLLKGTFGYPIIHKLYEWNVTAAYKYLETDATLDSINDADFHLGGTNAKGYILTGSLGVAKDTFLSLRYFSSQVISGPPDGNQVVQLDLQTSF